MRSSVTRPVTVGETRIFNFAWRLIISNTLRTSASSTCNSSGPLARPRGDGAGGKGRRSPAFRGVPMGGGSGSAWIASANATSSAEGFVSDSAGGTGFATVARATGRSDGTGGRGSLLAAGVSRDAQSSGDARGLGLAHCRTQPGAARLVPKATTIAKTFARALLITRLSPTWREHFTQTVRAKSWSKTRVNSGELEGFSGWVSWRGQTNDDACVFLPMRCR